MKRMKKKQRNALVRKLIVLIQLITLLGCTAFVFLNELLPIKYLAVISGGLFGMWLICFGMQSLKSRIYLLGLVVSIGLSGVQFAGIACLEEGHPLLARFEGETVTEDDTTKEDMPENTVTEDDMSEADDSESASAEESMMPDYNAEVLLVVVKNDNEAETLQEAAEYSYGIYDPNGNKDKILAEIESITGTAVEPVEYEHILDIAWGLLDGEVQAVIFEGSYLPEIEYEIEGFCSKIKMLHEYAVE